VPQQAIAAVRGGFPEVEDYPDDRIRFLVSLTVPPYDGTWWVRVLDETWATFEYDPPNAIWFVIRDNPGDAELSEYNWISTDMKG
jgi:hypothetical protein